MNFEEESGSNVAGGLVTRMAVGTVLLLSVLSAAVILYGCGHSESPEAAAGGDGAAAVAVPAEETGQTVEAVPAAVTVPDASSDGGGNLPPEIALQPMDTLVIPGQAVTISVEATPDVCEMQLSDGINDPQAMVRDASGDGTWRVDYRVPLRPREERFGLSVTAKNEAHRWRRVWVFLNVQKPGIAIAEPDTTPAEK